MNTILFDLDGTLLSMDMHRFEQIYFSEIAKVFPERDQLVNNIMRSTKTMVMNLDPVPNKMIFMEDFAQRSGMDPDCFMDRFTNFYLTDFDVVKDSLVHDKPLVKTVQDLKKKGYRIVLATNPLFPKEATYKRIRWAGFEPEDFEHITTFEESCYLKPQLEYYKEILSVIGCKPEDCLMVGNDAHEDLIAGKLGMQTYLITDHLLNRGDVEIVCDNSGTYEDFKAFAEDLASI